MIKLGDWNELTVNRFTDHGAYLDGGQVGEILMPNAYLQRGVRMGDKVNVFVYLDQEERLVATTEQPLARVGEFAWLRVSWVNEYGAFLHWGVMKDLFVPFREQKMRMEKDRYYLVYIYIDSETHRIVGTAKVERWLKPALQADFSRGEEVELLVQQKTDLGFKAVVNNAFQGLIYRDQIFEEPHAGDRLRGFVMNVRPDGKLDLTLQPLGVNRFRDFADVLLEEIKAAGGEIPFTDRSASEDIAERFGVSKKTFKRAVGTLYKSRKIELREHSIALSSE